MRRSGRADVRVVDPPPPETPPDPSPAEPEPADPTDDPPLETAPDGPKPDAKPEKRPERPERPGRSAASALNEIRDQEEGSLRDWLTAMGTDGAFKVQLRREQPEHIFVRGKQINTKGYLNTFDRPIDEESIQRTYGGGTYSLKVTFRSENGSYQYRRGFHRTITIAGDPNPEALPQASPAAEPAAPQPEAPSVVTRAFDILSTELHRARDAPRSSGIDPAVQMLIDQNRDQMLSITRQMAELQRENTALRNQKPVEDPIKEKILGSLIDGQSGHVTALQLRHDSEIRQIKESARDDLKRIEDRHDREVLAMRQSHELAIATLKASYEREIAALRQSHEVAMASAVNTAAIQSRTLEGEVKRLERDVADLRADNKELREKKDKSVIEQIKDMKVLREAFSDGDEESSGGGTIGRIVEAATSPAAIEGISKILGRGGPPAAQVQAQATAAAAAARPPRVVRDATGQRFVQHGDKLIPAKPKPKVITTEGGQQIEAPVVDADQIKMLIAYLEQAYQHGQDPEVVAQSGRSTVPPDILAWIKDNDTEATSGVDLFMSKVAKLPGTSPLASQAGRNWLRKVGKALAGG